MLLDHVTSKWGVLLLVSLAEGPMRWSELRRRAEGISEKMLAQTLKTLERDGLVHRDAQPVIPPRVDYSLTPLGEELVALMLPLFAWVAEHADEIVGDPGLTQGQAHLATSHVDVVVLLEERLQLLVAGLPATLRHLDQGFEVGLARGAGGEQDQHRRGFAGLVAEAVQPALRHVDEVAGRPSTQFVPSKSCTTPESTKNDSVNVRWKWAPGPPGFGPMSQR